MEPGGRKEISQMSLLENIVRMVGSPHPLPSPAQSPQTKKFKGIEELEKFCLSVPQKHSLVCLVLLRRVYFWEEDECLASHGLLY